MGERRDFLVPDLGEGLEEVTVVRWEVAEGATVALNQVLCLVETAKAEVEVPSPFAGTLTAFGGEEGETLAVGTLLASFEVVGDSEGAAPVVAEEEPVSTRQPTLVGYGHDEGLDRRRRRPTAPLATGARPIAAPPVRKLAADLGVDLADVAPGSGPGGLVTRADLVGAGPGTTVLVTGVRARIAEHLSTSNREIPDASCSVVVDCTRMLEVRELLQAAAERRAAGTKVTSFSLLCRLLVHALRQVPALNATWHDDGPTIEVHDTVHLGIATATDRGLLVPVVRGAERRSTLDLSSEINRLAEGARAGSLAPSELVGSTFTVSNFGALGLDEGIPVVNWPEAAILGVGSIALRPRVVDGEVVARPTASLTLAFDHRVADGAEAGMLLSTLRELVHAPELALLDA